MASDVTMPRLSDSMEEGTVLKWLVDEGGEVKRGEPLVEIETDKANMTYDADTDGVLVEIVAQEGDTLPIGEVIARIGDAGEAKSGGGDEEEGGDEAEAGDGDEEAAEARGPTSERRGRRGRRGGAGGEPRPPRATATRPRARATRATPRRRGRRRGRGRGRRRSRGRRRRRGGGRRRGEGDDEATRTPTRARRPLLPAPRAAVARPRRVPGPPLVRRLRRETVTGV